MTTSRNGSITTTYKVGCRDVERQPSGKEGAAKFSEVVHGGKPNSRIQCAI